MFHEFEKNIAHIDLPKRLNNPFCYAPHLLALMASNQLQAYIKTRTDWTAELSAGKMFGVLVCRNIQGKVGFVAAFSGQIQGQNLHPYFVPPVYDLTAPNDFYKKCEAEITAVNQKIEALSQEKIIDEYADFCKNVDEQLATEKEHLKQTKLARDERRKATNNPTVLAELIRESQFQKAEYKRLQKRLDEQRQVLETEYNIVQTEIETLCQQRRAMSNALQERIFEHFVFHNARGEQQNALQIWNGEMPPAGTGECCAPRLLEYAYRNGLTPITMAEFWWGHSPKGEIRRHLNFYRACKQKCEPILNFMLQGLDVEPNRFSQEFDAQIDIEVLYEDDYLLAVNKPIDFLSVPGNIPQPSVQRWAQQHYSEAYAVHRLDMATSGVLLIAKSKQMLREMQILFENRQVQKEYVALLDGESTAPGKGKIELKICPHFEERPMQKIDDENGKFALTEYQILERKNGRTRVLFHPKTGRTHQLRLHSAHERGLGCPIIGDTLYGTPADRLYLHAQRTFFVHPITQKPIDIFCPCPF